jgi:hypothetical protein
MAWQRVLARPTGEYVDTRADRRATSCGVAKLQRYQAGLADLKDPGHFHDRGFPLPLCKAIGLSVIRISAGKPLTVFVKQSHLPVVVLSPCIFLEWYTFHNLNKKEYIMRIVIRSDSLCKHIGENGFDFLPSHRPMRKISMLDGFILYLSRNRTTDNLQSNIRCVNHCAAVR